MIAAGVLVSCHEAGSKTPRRCSGIRLSRDWVLTTGSILNSGLQDNSNENVTYWENMLDKTYQDHLVHIKREPLMESQITFSVITSFTNSTVDEITSTSEYLGSKEGTLMPVNNQFRTEGSLLNCQEKHGNSVALAVQSLSSDTHCRHKEFRSILKYAWRSRIVSDAVDTILSSWVVGSISYNENESSIETESDTTKNLLSLFLLLKLQTDNDNSSVTEEYSELVDILRHMFGLEKEVLRRGQSVLVESTPFGNYCFHNSVSGGVISNVCGPGHCLLLTDASTALGCEGGPISVIVQKDGKPKRRLVGMVVCSLSWWRGEWVGFSVGVSLQPIVSRLLLPDALVTNSPSLISPETSPDHLAGVDDCVVLVRCGVRWGSGVVVDSRDGIVLTCSHVVRNARNGQAQVYWNNLRYTASILFRSRDGLAYDVAVLRTGPGAAFRSVNLSCKAAVKGEPVMAAGFSLFSEEDNVRPTVTRGIMTLVPDPMAMLQTNCCVQSGASGGALFRFTGDLVGLISCNIMDTSRGAIFPRINMAVPTSVLVKPLNDFLRSGDVQFLSVMESKDPDVQRLWQLQSTISKL